MILIVIETKMIAALLIGKSIAFTTSLITFI